MQNPGWQAGASRDRFGGLSHLSTTSLHWKEQALAFRFGLSPSMARRVSWLCFGEGRDD